MLLPHRADISGQRLRASGFSDFAASACAAAAALPPTAVCSAERRPQTEEALATLRLATACFPVAVLALDASMSAAGPGQSTAPGATTSDERAALLALLRRQLAGEGAAMKAAALERRLGQVLTCTCIAVTGCTVSCSHTWSLAI